MIKDFEHYEDMSVTDLEALCEKLQAIIKQKMDETTPPLRDQFPMAQHLSLVAAIESLIYSYRNLRHTLVFDEQRQLDKTSVPIPALQSFHTRMERLCAVIHLHRNTPLPPTLAASISELKGLIYYRCLADISLPSVIADDMMLFSLADHLMESLDSLRKRVVSR